MRRLALIVLFVIAVVTGVIVDRRLLHNGGDRTESKARDGMERPTAENGVLVDRNLLRNVGDGMESKVGDGIEGLTAEGVVGKWEVTAKKRPPLPGAPPEPPPLDSGPTILVLEPDGTGYWNHHPDTELFWSVQQGGRFDKKLLYVAEVNYGHSGPQDKSQPKGEFVVKRVYRLTKAGTLVWNPTISMVISKTYRPGDIREPPQSGELTLTKIKR